MFWGVQAACEAPSAGCAASSQPAQSRRLSPPPSGSSPACSSPFWPISRSCSPRWCCSDFYPGSINSSHFGLGGRFSRCRFYQRVSRSPNALWTLPLSGKQPRCAPISSLGALGKRTAGGFFIFLNIRQTSPPPWGNLLLGSQIGSGVNKNRFTLELPGSPVKKTGILFKMQLYRTKMFSFNGLFLAIP